MLINGLPHLPSTRHAFRKIGDVTRLYIWQTISDNIQETKVSDTYMHEEIIGQKRMMVPQIDHKRPCAASQKRISHTHFLAAIVWYNGEITR